MISSAAPTDHFASGVLNAGTSPTGSVTSPAWGGSTHSAFADTSVSPTGSVTSPAWEGSCMGDDFGDEDFGGGLDFDAEDEMLAMALAPGVRMARSMSIGGGDDEQN